MINLKQLFAICLFLVFCTGLHAQDKVPQWGVFELTLKGSDAGDPFINTVLVGEFRHGNEVFRPEGFYDGDGIYKIRFMPDKQGEWTYSVTSNHAELDKKHGSFTCTAADKNVHGPVVVSHKYHFAYADSTAYTPFGTTIYEWAFQNQETQNETIQTLKSSPFNKVRMLAIPPFKGGYVDGPDKLTVFPFVGTSKENFDFSRFNPEFFRRLEKNIKQLEEIGVESDLILFRPYDGGKWGFDKMDDETNIRFLKYMVARFAAFHNIWWSLCNENSFIRQLTDEDWDRYFQVVQKADPYGHLRSIHNADRIYDYTKPWVTHVSLQYYNVAKAPFGSSLLRDIYRKPIVNDEINYEGNIERRWGQLTGEEMTFRFWNVYIGGGFATHGETTSTGWIGKGGKLNGQSPARIAFLKKIVEAGPQEGLTPIDHFYSPNLAGKAGEYYLLYFGKDTPATWDFKLPKEALTDGMKFKVDVIDTWNMTITPVNKTFEIKKSDNYSFSDKSAPVKLTGKPYMALRITRVDGGKTPTKPQKKQNELNEDLN
ncbi:uncharacterized protein DUF4038 [Mucilaginibacter yixingensis]|uniref:Uncharacterized protein DUF4038 n=1 Tax=Mucilaginibacter yixingensis TaxID=1295612 RepID=A0A2T5JFV6_9SPHI|nr:DUF5605 domain-containing protein [Mucilaginibacter yixingensis]PTR01307.1 uncharacterized protein DUF4038 [Mucilaginibacter yixingensis]